MSGIPEAIRALTNPEKLLDLLTPLFSTWIGYAVLFAIVFAETGLLVGFFLPGDSLLFLVGTVAGAGNLDIVAVNIVLMAAAVLGDTFGFALGWQTGPQIFKRPDSRLFRREHLERTHAFYEKHGGKTIIYARFVPIIRTFAPFVAGAGKIEFRPFIFFNAFCGETPGFRVKRLPDICGGLPPVQQPFETDSFRQI